MTNYDYNKGYRGFRFKKDNNIDQKLPALKTYLAHREKSSIHWITKSKRGLENLQTSLAFQRERFLNQIADNTSSILYFPRIVSTTPQGNLSVNGLQVPDEDSMEGMLEKYNFAAPVNVTPASLIQKETPGLETAKETFGAPNSIIKRKTPRDFSYGEIKTRKQSHRVKHRKQGHPQNHDIYLRNKKLEECLVIQNGIESTNSRTVGESKLLTRQKTEDIINWMDKMAT